MIKHHLLGFVQGDVLLFTMVNIITMKPTTPPDGKSSGQINKHIIFMKGTLLLMGPWNPVNSPVEVGSLFPIIYRVSAPSQVVSQISAINSINLDYTPWN